MAEGDIPTEGQAAGSGSSNRAERSLAARGAEKIMRDKLVDLPALKREDDPRWQAVYDTKPADGAPPPRDPEDPESDKKYLDWRANQRDNKAEYSRRADESLKTEDPDAFERYQRYGLYNPPASDPEARHLFMDDRNNTIKPTDAAIKDFEQKYPEKAALYEEAIENAKLRTPRNPQQRIEDTATTPPSSTEAQDPLPVEQNAIVLPPAIEGAINNLPDELKAAARHVSEQQFMAGDQSEEDIISGLNQRDLIKTIGNLPDEDIKAIQDRRTNKGDDDTPPPPATEARGGSNEPPETPPDAPAASEEPNDEENAGKPPPEIIIGDENEEPEDIYSREVVLDAFNSAFAAWENYPSDKLTDDQIASRDLLRDIRSKTVDIGKDSYVYSFKVGDTRIRQTERPPVGSLHAFVVSRMNSGELTDDQIEEYKKWDRVLINNSHDYYRFKRRREDDRRFGRIASEIQRVTDDPRLDTGDTEKNAWRGTENLNRRMELKIPPDISGRIPKEKLPKKPVIIPEDEDLPENKDWSKKEITDALIRDRDREEEFIDRISDGIRERRSVHDPITSFYPRNFDESDIENMLHGWWVGNPNDISDWDIEDALDHLWLSPTDSESGGPEGPQPPSGPENGEPEGPENGGNNPTGEPEPTPNPTNPEPTPGGPEPTPAGRLTEPTRTRERETLPPVPTTPLEEAREIWFANRSSDIMKRAGELAETQLQHEQRRGNILNPLNWFRKSGMRIFEEYYRQVYTERARKAMVENSNSYLDMDLVKNAAVEAEHKAEEEREAGKAKIEQLRTGEHIKGQDVYELTDKLKTALLDRLVKPVVNGESLDQKQIQEKLRAFVNDVDENKIAGVTREQREEFLKLFGKDANQYQRVADYFATDLLEMGEMVKRDFEAHKEALNNIDVNIDSYLDRVHIKFANTDWASEGQSKFNTTDKLANFLRNRLGGPFKNPALAGAITSLGLYGAFRVAGYGGKAASIMVPGSGALTGAVLGAVRRNYDLKVDRASHQVARAYNYEIAPKSRNREKLEKFAYDTTSVKELINGLAEGQKAREAFGDTRGLKDLLKLPLTVGENQDAVMRRVAEIRARLDISAEKNADLITFSGRTNVEQERLALIKSVVEAKMALRNAGLTDPEITAKTAEFGGQWRTQLEKNMQDQDKEFNKYKLKESVKTGFIGGVTGLAAGLVVHEVGADIFNYNHTIPKGPHLHTDAIDELHKDAQKTYGSAGIPRIFGDLKKFAGDALGTRHHNVTPEHTGGNMSFDGGAGNIHETIGHNNISIPPGTELVNNSGHYDLIAAGHPDHTLISNVVGPDGRVNLNAAGAAGEIHSQVATQDILGPQGEWAKSSTNITRQWYGNNTPFSDRNELRVDNSVFTAANGQKGVDFDMSRMMGASFQNGNSPESINVAQALSQGKMGISFTTDDNPQNALFIAFDSRGHLNLDPTDFAHHINADPNSMTRGEAAQILLNQNRLSGLNNGPLESELFNHRDVFNLSHGGKPGVFEVGELVDGGPSGHRLNVLATGLGTGHTPDTINTTSYSIDVNKIPGLPEAIKHKGTEVPIIPFPYTPRHTLERMNGGNEENIEPATAPRRGETETLPQAGRIIEGLTAQERIPAYTISETQNEKSKELLDSVQIHGDEFDGKNLTREILEQEGLGPKHEIKVEGGPTFYVSDPYLASGGRAAFVGYVEKNGELLARTYYRSGSQGVFRYLPGYQTDDMGNIDWFSKGFGEESITLPVYIQEGLANITTSTQPKTVTDPNLIFAGTARDINKQTEGGNTYVREVESTPIRLEGDLFPGDPRTKLNPEDLKFTNEGDSPNFAEPLLTWSQSNNIYGNYTSQVFISKNKQYKYIFNQDANGKVWIGGIENNSPIQSTGLRQSWVTGGDLLTPAYEYESQSFGFGNEGDKKGQYIDVFTNYLSKIPVIQEYIESQAQPRPAPTLAELGTQAPRTRLTVTPIEATDNTMAAVRLDLGKKLETTAGNETVLSFTPEQLSLLFQSIHIPSGQTTQDLISKAEEGKFIDVDNDLKEAIEGGSLPEGWTIGGVSLENGNVLFDFKKAESTPAPGPVRTNESAIPLDPEEAELGEKLYELIERLDLERPKKEAITKLIEENLPLGLGELLSESSQEEVLNIFEDSILALKGKTQEELTNKESTGSIPAITAYIQNAGTLHGEESALREERVLLHVAESSPRIKELLESSDDIKQFHIMATIDGITWEYLNAREPKTEPTTLPSASQNLESSTPAPEAPVTEEQKAELETMVRQLPPELQAEVTGQQNEYQKDFAPLIRAIQNGSIAAELANPARRVELQGAATIVQRETANIPELNEYYKIVEQNKDNANLVAGLNSGAAIIMDETAATPRLEQTPEGPRIHMSLETATLLVGRESAMRIDEVIQRIEKNEPPGITAEEFIASAQSMLEIIRGRDQTNQT